MDWIEVLNRSIQAIAAGEFHRPYSIRHAKARAEFIGQEEPSEMCIVTRCTFLREFIADTHPDPLPPIIMRPKALEADLRRAGVIINNRVTLTWKGEVFEPSIAISLRALERCGVKIAGVIDGR